ncbi:MAG: hypothetical protein WCG47_03080, partial [Dermatophilaceae bacterium]
MAAETINGPRGLGGLVRDAQRYNNTAAVLVGIFAIGLPASRLTVCSRWSAERSRPGAACSRPTYLTRPALS